MGKSVFISYRREDSRADTRSIYQRLERTFGPHRLFMDVDSIQRGRDFTKVLDEHLLQCGAILVVIGAKWLTAVNERGQRRLDDPGDFVRLEVSRALARDVLVIPLLVDGAQMPTAADLPDDLKPLAKRQALSVTHEKFPQDMYVLERDLAAIVGQKRRTTWVAAAIAACALAVVFAASQLYVPSHEPASRPGATLNTGETQAGSDHQRVSEAAEQERQRGETQAAEAKRNSAYETQQKNIAALPPGELANTAILELKYGSVKIRLRPDLAPQHVARVKKLIADGFYNGLKFHRVIKGFMAQTGDPTGTGRGGSSYPNLAAEFSTTPFRRGVIGAARSSDPNSANSQFFICLADAPNLNGQYTVWGEVLDGMQYVDMIAKGEPPPQPDTIVSMYTASSARN